MKPDTEMITSPSASKTGTSSSHSTWAQVSLCVCVCVCVCVSVCLSVCLSQPLCQSLAQSLCPCLSVCPSFSLPPSLFLSLSASLSFIQPLNNCPCLSLLSRALFLSMSPKESRCRSETVFSKFRTTLALRCTFACFAFHWN